MIKARKRDIEQLNAISLDLLRGLNTLMSDRYELASPTSGTSTDIFTAPYYPDKRYAIINKHIGHELVPMFTAINRLHNLLNTTE
jgi:hypothetical protein